MTRHLNSATRQQWNLTPMAYHIVDHTRSVSVEVNTSKCSLNYEKSSTSKMCHHVHLLQIRESALQKIITQIEDVT